MSHIAIKISFIKPSGILFFFCPILGRLNSQQPPYLIVKNLKNQKSKKKKKNMILIILSLIKAAVVWPTASDIGSVLLMSESVCSNKK